MGAPQPVARAIDTIECALVAAMKDAAAFADVKVTHGYPVGMGNLAAWVSYTHDTEREAAASNLTLGKNTTKMGGGIAVSQMVGDDWQPIADRLHELTDAFEALIGPQFGGDPTLGATCMSAFLSRHGMRETDEELSGASKGRLTWLFELTVILYA